MKREVWPGNEDGASGALPDPRLARALPFSLPDLNLHPLGSAERRKPGAGSWGTERSRGGAGSDTGDADQRQPPRRHGSPQHPRPSAWTSVRVEQSQAGPAPAWVVRSRLASPAPTHPVLDLGREPVGRALVELRGAHGAGPRRGTGGPEGPAEGRAAGGRPGTGLSAAPAADWLAEQMSL